MVIFGGKRQNSKNRDNRLRGQRDKKILQRTRRKGVK